MEALKSILVVDDDANLRALIVRQLSPHFNVTEAPDGRAALDILARRPLPDAIVCDVMMPGMRGTDLVRYLKNNAEHKHIPIIFLTALSSPMDVIEGINAGARYYIAKPFQMHDLLAKVERAVGAKKPAA
jgi:DNA-binding response OmpR family regulator